MGLNTAKSPPIIPGQVQNRERPSVHRLIAVVSPVLLLLVALASAVAGALRIGLASWPATGSAAIESCLLLAVATAAATATGALWNSRHRTEIISTQLDSWAVMEQRAADLEAVRREQAKARMAVDGLSARVAEVGATLREREQSLLGILDDVQKALIDSRQTRAEAEAATRRWDSLAMLTVDDLHRVADRPGVRGPLDDLIERLQSVGLDVVEPSPSTKLDERLHEVSAEETSPDVQPGAVLRTAALGYRRGERVLRRARVVQATAPEETTMGASSPVPPDAPSQGGETVERDDPSSADRDSVQQPGSKSEVPTKDSDSESRDKVTTSDADQPGERE